jgi:hypothetical protein
MSGFGTLGAAGTVRDIQTRLAALGKISSSNIDPNGIINDATVAALYKLAFEDVVKVQNVAGSISGDVATAIGYIVSILNGINSLLCCGITPDDLFKNWGTSLTVIRAAAATADIVQDPDHAAQLRAAADKLEATRATLYNGIAGRADQILKVMNILNPPPTTGTQPPPLNPKAALLATIRPQTQVMQMIAVASSAAPGTTSTPGALPVIPGTIWARSTKFPGMIRIAIPRPVGGGFGGIGLMSDGVFGNCIFGNCGSSGLGAAAPLVEQAKIPAPAPGAPLPGGQEVAETELEKQTGQTPFYKKPLFWAAIAGGVVVVGGGSYWLIRRRKRSA